jgi:hypothetical protein
MFVRMKKVLLVGTPVVVLLIVASYCLLVPKKMSIPVPINTTNDSGWLYNLIKEQENNPIANPPALLSKCTYKNQEVYYLPPRCCDIPSILYDDKGDVLCSPDGGFTGKGDGKCMDFLDSRKNCVIIWKDTRNR